ncbi:MAG: hypothetical protein M1816_004946 [Peltula sp. TS41687]|nr:MAG: hypothetical protein M1816_004946 [Peltula sp. TS41687]
MELLIMISACKGGSANKITAVLPYFPYCRQSKKKSHRGAITARMLANLLSMAGVHHIITVDLHASQMQGFFGKPVDNLYAEPLIARWIRHHVPNWREAVVVSKNPGGTKRVTSLADVLKLNFGIVTTDKRRGNINMSASTILNGVDGAYDIDGDVESARTIPSSEESKNGSTANSQVNGVHPSSSVDVIPSSLMRNLGQESETTTDGRARNVITGRLFRGQLVDDDFSSPSLSMTASTTTLSGEREPEPLQDPMSASVFSTSSHFSTNAEPNLDEGGGASDEEEDALAEHEVAEQMITLVGNVKDKSVFIVDDMIDKARSWIAAAETVVKRGGAKKVYCIATHGLFGDDCLQEMVECDCIDYVVVTNSYPIEPEKSKMAKRKLVILDISPLLAEAIRRNHYGESVSQLYQQYYD